MNQRILVVGDVIDDIIVIPSQATRKDTDTPASVTRHAGGSAANTAAWLGSIKADTVFYGRVGKGDLERHRAELEAFGVHVLIGEDEARPTGSIVILVEGESRTMFTDRGANENLDLDELPDELLHNVGFLHITGHTVLAASKPEAISRLIERAHRHGVKVSIDPASAGFISDFGVSRFLELIEHADILRPNRDELALLSGESDSLTGAKKLAQRFGLVVATLGRDGVIVAAGAAATAFEVEPVKVIDPTGAGDTFNAGLLGSLALGLNPQEAAKSAAVLAASGLQTVGARPTSL